MFCVAATEWALPGAEFFTGTIPRDLPARADLVFVSDDRALTGEQGTQYHAGCDAISVIDVRDGQAVTRSEGRVSAGQLAVTSDGSLTVWVGGNYPGCFVGILRWRGPDTDDWATTFVDAARAGWCTGVLRGGPPAISPDDRLLLIPLADAVEKYFLADVVAGSLSPIKGAYRKRGLMPAAIVFAADGRTAYVVGSDALVHVLDVTTMTRAHDPIPYAPAATLTSWRVRRTRAALSPDGGYLVIGTADNQGGRINVVDVASRRSVLVMIPELSEAWDVAFSYREPSYGLLAVHGRTRVGVYRFDGSKRPGIVAAIDVPPQPRPQEWADPEFVMMAALAWTGRGDGLVVAIGGRATGPEWRALEFVRGDAPALEWRLDFDSCTWPGVNPPETGIDAWPAGIDVASLNDRLPGPSLTPSPASTATGSPAPTFTPTGTPSVTVTQSATMTATTTPTATDTPRPPRAPLYVPLAIREECVPGQQHADVALVIDASSSMRGQLTSSGRRKLDAAREAVALFVGQLDLAGGDQATIVQFNADAALLSPLTHDRAVLERALSTIEVARQTRIQAGIHVAREELTSARRRAVNNRAMVVLTDGANNPEPVSEAEREAGLARTDGIRVFTVGLGVEVESAALQRMATSAADYFYAPDGEDLAAIYRRIAYAIPCPPEAFWGGR